MLLQKANPFSFTHLPFHKNFHLCRKMSLQVSQLPIMKKTSQISLESFKELGMHSQSFIKANYQWLMLETNESGFVRINIPLNELMRSKYPEISKIRLNFWTSEFGVEIVEESIHTHPAHFQSLILNGGYIHELFEIDESNKPTTPFYDHYKIFKQINQKSFTYIGKSYLTTGVHKSEEQGSIVNIPPNLIHRVLDNLPKTLTLNAVSDSNEANHFNIFLTQNANISHIKTNRKMVPTKHSKIMLDEILHHLSDYTKS